MVSGINSNKTEANSMETLKLQCKEQEVAVSAAPICIEMPCATSLHEEHQKATMIEKHVFHYSAPREGGSQESLEMDAGCDRVLGESTPMLESDKGIDEPCLPDSKNAESGMEGTEPSRSACFTMSLALYPTRNAENESTDIAGLNEPESFASTAGPSGGGWDHMKVSGLSSIRQRQRQTLAKPAHNQLSDHPETPKETYPQVPIRVARPPGEGRGRNQLLPRYWPRITDQELQQITSGDSNSTITPLFEKMLSASDAGRIGRLVLPKACAEAYFPPISQPEGLPLKIQDISGKEWVFQFRFWPNNNSRMYVLEGVTPCIQSMQLQAGDTVTFSRLDPEGKLVMGYRRAPDSLSAQEPQLSSVSTAPVTLTSDNSTIASLTGLLSHSITGISGLSNVSDMEYGWYKSENSGSKTKERSLFQSLVVGDKRKGRQISSKSKRLQAEPEEFIEFKISWEEAQYLLRPPPNIAPIIVTIEDQEFEEYEEPPVFGKRTIFTTRKFGPGEDQWAQCDDCGSWRKVPPDVFLPTRWACSDNAWDSRRASCNAPQEVNGEEIDLLLWHFRDAKKEEVAESVKVTEPSSGLERHVNSDPQGENNTASSSSPAPTTKHPRHRPGCTCIVCIQPPSGKGPKHNPTCSCNVCMTVKRRFKTLMMRRKKRQSEREAESCARKKRAGTKESGEVDGVRKYQTGTCNVSNNCSRQGSLVVAFPGALPTMDTFPSNGNRLSSNVGVTSSYTPRGRSSGDQYLISKGQIDLNIQPEREEETNRGAGRVSMVRLLQNASYPLDRYLKQQGLASLVCPEQLLVPSMNCVRNVISRKVDEHNGNQWLAVITSDRDQEESHLTLGISKLDIATSSQGLEVLERKSGVQASSQST